MRAVSVVSILLVALLVSSPSSSDAILNGFFDWIHNAVSDAESCVCSLQYQPVCGSDGITYGNKCALKCAQKQSEDLQVTTEVACKGQGRSQQSSSEESSEEKQMQKNCRVSTEFEPVCAKNGKTFANKSVFKCHQKANPDLKLRKMGICSKSFGKLSDTLSMDAIKKKVHKSS